MDNSGYSGYRDNRPHSNINYQSGYERNYSQYSPKNRQRNNDYRPETEYHTHTFQKNKGGRENRDHSMRNLPPKYFDIKPHLDNILSDQISQNKEVQRNLKDLKSLNEKLLSDLGGSGHEKRNSPVKGSYWDEIQRLIMQIINNSENQTSEFKASLQHLKNIKDKTLQQDLGYYESDQPSYIQHKADRRPIGRPNYQPQSRERYVGQFRPFSETFNPQTENEYRLMDEIASLKQENRQLRRRLNQQISKNRQLTHRVRELQASDNQTHDRRINDRSRVGYGRSDKQAIGHLQNLSQRLQDVDYENNHLRQQLRHLKQQGQRGQSGQSGNNQSLRHIRDLQGYVSASQKRANNYENIKNNQHFIIDQLKKLKSQNNELRKDTVDLLKSNQNRNRTSSQYQDNNNFRNIQSSVTQNRDYYSNNNGYRRNEARRDVDKYY